MLWRARLSLQAACGSVNLDGLPHPGAARAAPQGAVSRSPRVQVANLLANSSALEDVQTNWRHKKPPLPGASFKRMMGLEPTTFCMAIVHNCAVVRAHAPDSVTSRGFPRQTVHASASERRRAQFSD